MSIDVPGQIHYWLEGSRENLEAAELLIKNGKILEGLFFTHLAVEKALKGVVVKQTRTVPPRTHNLQRLTELAGLTLSNDHFELFTRLMLYQLEGRYPTEIPLKPSEEFAENLFHKTVELIQWLRNQL